ncbi:MAG TPA: DegT/DnrJ/EryC1/StrS aminotransferase family protein [Marmoricola sp.]|nr:DegT/DnrJ/EryC1/StrS aminotransferase family protein [Marmoricola sp.]
MGSDVIPFSRPVVAPEASAALERVLTSGWLTTGPECAAFEEEFAAWVGARHAAAVSSCTAAIEISLRGLRLPPGSRVLVPTITFCGVVEAVLHAGLVPVLTDVDPASGLATPGTTAAAARDCGGADALVVLHYAGCPVEVEALADAAGVPLSRVVEDAAHALGTWVGDRQVGSISQATCFSFYATKNLPIGEGGMITTDDGELDGWVRSTRLHGMSRDAWRRYLPGGAWRYSVEQDGMKANLSDVHAAIGRVGLRHLADWQQRRSEIASRYAAALGDAHGLALPWVPDRGRHAWHLYPLRVQPDFPMTRDALVAHLGNRGIGTSVHFIPVHQLPYLRTQSVVPHSGLAGADSIFDELLSLPMSAGLTDQEVDAVCAAVLEVAARNESVEV